MKRITQVGRLFLIGKIPKNQCSTHKKAVYIINCFSLSHTSLLAQIILCQLKYKIWRQIILTIILPAQLTTFTTMGNCPQHKSFKFHNYYFNDDLLFAPCRARFFERFSNTSAPSLVWLRSRLSPFNLLFIRARLRPALYFFLCGVAWYFVSYSFFLNRARVFFLQYSVDLLAIINIFSRSKFTKKQLFWKQPTNIITLISITFI